MMLSCAALMSLLGLGSRLRGSLHERWRIALHSGRCRVQCGGCPAVRHAKARACVLLQGAAANSSFSIAPCRLPGAQHALPCGGVPRAGAGHAAKGAGAGPACRLGGVFNGACCVQLGVRKRKTALCLARRTRSPENCATQPCTTLPNPLCRSGAR